MLMMIRAAFSFFAGFFIASDEAMSYVKDRAITLSMESEVDLVVDTVRARARMAEAIQQHQVSQELLDEIADRRSGAKYRKK